ncbi:DUF4097 family beta strand repeat-containing protein [Ornithinibacillus sp. 179-J 7C1 HS]|uniref:DUF4097 family beta strand repeat-containing protein n=1 Tax=Ornithinibacillus sp. 179-J 7C1 HS TaxID=3142384 RepID=UPI00399FE9F0
MPKQKLLIIIASCLFVLGVVGSLITYQTAGASDEDVKETKIVENQSISKFEIETDNARVDVLPTTDEEITVEFTAPGTNKNKYKFNVEEEGDLLSVEVKEKRLQFLSVDLDFSFKGPNVIIYLPEKQYDELGIDVINGRVHVEDIEIANVDIETVNGRVELEGLKTNTTTVSSENGGVNLTHVDGDIISEVVNGRTTMITNDLDRSINLESVNGKIDIQTSNEPTNASIEVDVVNGKVDIFGDSSRSAVVGDGKHKIKLKTVNGSITVSK